MEANGAPYEIFAPDNRYVFVSLAKHIKEVDTAPDTVLSLQAASKQVRETAVSRRLVSSPTDAPTKIYHAQFQLVRSKRN